ncbi:ATP-binding protein [Chlorogloeopsis fritschii PCC 9212]|uniref:histidine kinase n=1 Tax=Chlorogloeopsis fritschii PCC 6912 TaxID=211165 RepID=A0A433MX76_CHLFR|nr:ATP-binding protein [Chlorogloeopsis fritschii]RUR72687.1 hypothetical protein PCC6912_61530 [Chlorogloeopsis fritschii PCC 6912]
MQRPQRDTVTLKDIVITEELSRRNPRSANLLKENQALHALARQLVNQPQTMLQTLVDIALDLCNAGTAGVSLIETTPTGEEVFRWNVLAGALARYVGGTNPRKFSPCGVCLDRGSPQLYSHPERYFTDLQAANTPIVEGLVLPLIADNHALGTIWIMSHDEQRHFDSEDVRIMTSLADFTATVLLLKQRQKGELLAANAALEAEIVERRQAEERSHALISNLPGGAAFVVDRNLRYLLAEGEALAIAGFKPEDFVGHTIFEVLPPELAANYEPMYRAALAGEAFEHEHHAHDRTYISRGTPLRAENGEIYAVLAVSYDITERKRSEEALRESEERFRTLANTAPALIWYNDAQGNNRFINQYFLDFTGKSAEQIRGEGWHNLVHPDDAESYIADYLAAVREQRLWHNRNRIRRHDGVWRWHDNYAQPLFNANGVYLGHVGVTIDNTDAIEAEVALRESEAKYRSLFETMEEGLSVLELIYDDSGKPVDMRWLEANPAFEKITGLKNVAGRLTSEFVPSEDYWLETYDRVVKTGKPIRYENYHAGIQQWYRTHTSRVGGSESRVVANLFEDITDRKRREANIAFLNEIGKDLSVLSAPDEIIQTVDTRLGEFLQISGCIFADVDEAKNEATIHHGWNTADVSSLKQTFRLADYFGEEFARAGRAGETVIVRNTARDERANAEAYARLKIGSFVTVPFQQHGRWVANITVTSREPRDWRSDEIELLQEIASRVFPRIERARAEAALRESEEKYAALFAASPVPFMVLEPNPPDFTITAANEAYFAATLTTPEGLIGRRLFDVFTDDPNRPGTLGSEALALSLDRVLTSRRPDAMARTRYDIVTPDGGLEPHWWLAINAPLLNASGQVTAIIHQVTRVTKLHLAEEAERENQERQAFLLKLNDILQRFVQPNDIKAAAMRLLGEHLGVSRAQYHECDSSGEYYSADGVGYANGLPLLDLKYRIDAFGTFVNEDFAAGRPYRSDDLTVDPRISAEERDAYRTYQIGAGAGVPLIRGGKLVAILAIHDVHPHPWTDLEMDLIRETAERIWTPLERARAEEALRESEAKYRSLFTSIDEGFNLLEMIPDESGHPCDFRIVETNPAWEQQTGLTDAVGKTLLEIAPNFEQEWLDFYSDVLISGRGRRTEYYTASVDRWFTAYASWIGGEGSRQVAVVFNDISDRKRTEEQLRRAADMDAFRVKLSDVLRSLADPIEIQRAAMHVIGEHLAADRVFYTTMMPDNVTTAIHDNYVREGVPKLLGSVYVTDVGDAAVQLRNGETVVLTDVTTDEFTESEKAAYTRIDVVATIAVPLVKGNHWVATLVAHSRTPRQWTMTEVALMQETAERTWAAVERAKAEVAMRESELQRVREQSEREQERQRAESLAELDRAKTLFFSNVSHEFRTPLTLSLAPLQDALSDSANPLPQAQQERLELAHRNSLRLLKLVNTLLDFSRIEAGRRSAVYEPTDLALYTTELASVFRSAIERAGLQLIVDCPPIGEPVYVDREMWEKIVLNLLSNAFKFTLEGEIAVRLHLADDRYVTLQIEDTGTGIEPEELPHVFERFYQVRKPTARTHEGSGIGLALVHELIKMHGGTVDVSSTVGVGSCFTVTIPLGTAHLPSERIEATHTLTSTALGTASYVHEAERWLPEEENRVGGTGNREESCLSPVTCHLSPFSAHVLIVDDNADMRDYLKRILSEHVEVQAVADGAAALAAATERVPDLVLSDVMMPQMDGFELIKALRADARTKEVPIILLSARAGEESVIEGLQAGADDYLIKPFSATELVTRVNVHLQMAHLRSEALRQERTISRRKDEVLSTVSHELNTPLVAILGWARLLRSSPPNPAMLAKALETIERNATLQAKLVQDLLDISRIAAGKISLNYQSVDLKSIIDTAIATVRQSLETKDICLEYIVDPLSITVEGDPERLQQIVLNLLTNAIKFTPQGGRIKVRLDITENQAQIVVKDNGKGISAEFLPHVFDIFRQSESSHSKNGLGLGLAIAHHLVELHGGKIYAESPGVGRGATFTVKLPLVGVSL